MPIKTQKDITQKKCMCARAHERVHACIYIDAIPHFLIMHLE